MPVLSIVTIKNELGLQYVELPQGKTKIIHVTCSEARPEEIDLHIMSPRSAENWYCDPLAVPGTARFSDVRALFIVAAGPKVSVPDQFVLAGSFVDPKTGVIHYLFDVDGYRD